jgi:peptidoglycan/LPS O-acetylase OafA/YrhL
MAIGGILAYSKIKIANKIVANFISAVSLIMMVGTLFIIDQESLFPGWWALSPTLFAASVIVVENNSLFNKYVLSSRPLVYIGKISYPLYLWHWPLLVFSKLFYPKGSKSIFSNF